MGTEIRLEQFQRWMQTFIVHPGSEEDALAAAASEGIPTDEVTRVILPSSTLTSLERVGVYREMYLLRLAEALDTDYPALAHFLGGEAFNDLVAGYVEAFPSRSYTLNRLGDHLPEYIRTAPGIARRAFLHDLARLELAVSQVFDAPESPVLTEEQIAQVPTEAWADARLRPIEAFRLLSFQYPVNAYLTSVKEDDHDHPNASEEGHEGRHLPPQLRLLAPRAIPASPRPAPSPRRGDRPGRCGGCNSEKARTRGGGRGTALSLVPGLGARRHLPVRRIVTRCHPPGKPLVSRTWVSPHSTLTLFGSGLSDWAQSRLLKEGFLPFSRATRILNQLTPLFISFKARTRLVSGKAFE